MSPQLRIEEELVATAESDSAEVATARASRLQWSAERRIHSVHICLENLRNPGNRAAITRSMDGFGLLHLHEVDWEDPAIDGKPNNGGRQLGGQDPYVKKNKGKVMNGGEKWLHVHRHRSVADFVACVRQLTSERGGSCGGGDERNGKVEVEVLAAMPPPAEAPADDDPAASVRPSCRSMPHACLHDLSFGRPIARAAGGGGGLGGSSGGGLGGVTTVLVFGNEVRGVSAAMLEQCTGTFDIPQYGMVESLNVSVCVAVSCARAREAAGRGGDGSAVDAAALFSEYDRRGKETQFIKHNKWKQKAEDVAAQGGGAVVKEKRDKEARRAEWLAGQKAAAEKWPNAAGTPEDFRAGSSGIAGVGMGDGAAPSYDPWVATAGKLWLAIGLALVAGFGCGLVAGSRRRVT